MAEPQRSIVNYLDEAIANWTPTMDLPPLPPSEMRVEFVHDGYHWRAEMVPGPILGGKLVGVGATTVEAFISLRSILLYQIRRYITGKDRAANG